MLMLALAITQPVEAQSFKPDYLAGANAYDQKDYATALRHLRPLAERGDAKAQVLLVQIYRFAKPYRNYKEAIKWARKAAVHGDSSPQHSLGVMYSKGQGVLQDLVMAYVWLNLATLNSNYSTVDPEIAEQLALGAAEVRDKILPRLTASELKLARKLSKLCLKKPAKCPEYSDD